MKKIIYIFIMLLAIIVVTTKASNVEAASAPELIDGAQIRTDNLNGIKFVANVTPVDGATYGFVVGQGTVVDLTVDTPNTITGETTTLNEESQFYVTIVNIPERAYAQNLSVRAYVLIDGEYTYSTNIVTRSVGQVALGAQVKGTEGEYIETVAGSILENYKKVHVDYPGNTHVDDVLYETDHKKLAEKFVEDWNAMFETTLDAETAFVQGDNYASPFKTAARNNSTTNPEGANITAFFRDEAMYNKWGWILDYIQNELTTGLAFSACESQINCILNNTTDETGNWYYGLTLASYLQSIFCGKGSSTGSGRFNFERSVENMEKLALIVNYNNKVYSTFGELKLVKVGSDLKLEELSKENYNFDGYSINGTLYNETYNVTNDNVLLMPTFTAVEYDIKYYKDGVELTDLADVYTVEDAVTLPTITVEGYDFVGWCEDEACEGEVVTSLSEGSSGDKVYYAKYVEKQLKDVNVTYDLNGGYFNYPSLDDAIADFIVDFNASRNRTHTASTFYALGSWSEISDASNFLYDANYKAKWSWLVEYLATTAITATNKKAFEVFHNYTKQSELNAANSNYIYCIAYELRGWVGKAQYTQNSSFKSANYSSLIAQSETAAKGQTAYTYKDPCDLEVPTKDGYEFIGWTSSINGQVVTTFPGYYDNPGDITYTAVWEQIAPVLNVSIYVDASATTGSVYEANGKEYVYGTDLFATITDALANAVENDTIYVLAGTYSDAITISTANITICGPNAGVPYNGSRNEEAVISGTISVSANNFKLDGVKFTGTQIKATQALEGLTILNIVSQSNGALIQDSGGRHAVLGSNYNLSNLVIRNSKFYVPYATDGKNGLAFYGIVTNANIENNSFVNKLTASALNEAILLQKVAGEIYVTNNNIDWSTDNYSIFLGSGSNSATVIDVLDNVVNCSNTTYHTSGIAIRRIPASTTVNIVGNKIYNMGGNTFNFQYAVSGSKVNISYNYFDANTSFKCNVAGSATITTNNNCYAGGITTANGHNPNTSTETTYANLAALEEAYAKVK